jgi:hypothetical protein
MKALTHERRMKALEHARLADDVRRLGKTPIALGHAGRFNEQDWLTDNRFPFLGIDEDGWVIIEEKPGIDNKVSPHRITITF